ncbi:MAG: hypothetical protein EXS05_08080 [Planctomycetaceae bacterium]|nr:hypothetical protein [Planctomycetaceae bacterium]
MRINTYRVLTANGVTCRVRNYAAAIKAVRKTYGWRAVASPTWKPVRRNEDIQPVWLDDDETEQVAVITRVCLGTDC